MKPWTIERLAALSVHDRHTLWKKALTTNTPEASLLVEQIESLGLPYSDPKAVTSSEPLVQKMIDLIWTDEAKAGAVKATSDGLPALAGVEPVLIRELGVDYGPHNRGTLEAGFRVAEMMRSQGYALTGRKGDMPPGSVAKTAEIYAPNKKLPTQ